MSLVVLHKGLANAATLFLVVLAIWAFVQFFRSSPLDGNWLGAAVIGELLLVLQFVVGWLLWFQGFGVVLERPFMHILYGVVAIITLPAGYIYFNSIKQPRVQSLAMAAVCAFLWGIVLRAGQVVYLQVR